MRKNPWEIDFSKFLITTLKSETHLGKNYFYNARYTTVNKITFNFNLSNNLSEKNIFH